MSEKKARLFVRNVVDSEIGDAMLEQSIVAFQDFGKDVLGRDIELVSSGKPLPDIRDYISGGVLDRDAYHSDIWRVYDSNKDTPIFNLDIVDVPIMTEHYGQVNASSCQYFNSDTGENLSPYHQAVLLSTNPLFLRDDALTAGARAHILTWHENGHLVYDKQDGCMDDGCLMSHPENRKKGLDSWVSGVLSSGKLPICGGCVDLFKGFKDKKF